MSAPAVTESVDPRAVAELLAESDRRDRQLRDKLAWWRNGWRACEVALGDRYAAGYAQATSDIKAAQHGLYDLFNRVAQVEKVRWGPGGRARFGDAKPGDFRGRGGESA